MHGIKLWMPVIVAASCARQGARERQSIPTSPPRNPKGQSPT